MEGVESWLRKIQSSPLNPARKMQLLVLQPPRRWRVPQTWGTV